MVSAKLKPHPQTAHFQIPHALLYPKFAKELFFAAPHVLLISLCATILKKPF